MKLLRLVLLMFAVVVFVVLLFPLAAPYPPSQVNSSAELLPPSSQHAFGTDALGRDVLSRFLHGGQRTLLVSLLSVSIALIIGIPTGLLSGYFGGWLDAVILSVLNAMLALPGLFLALIILALLGPGTGSVGLAIGIAQIAPVGQVTRTVVRAIRHEPYITAAEAVGSTRHYIVLHVILVNALPTIAAYASVTFAYCLLNVAAFGYLGLIGTLEIPEWGSMLAEGREVYREAIWVSIAPGIALTLLVILANTFTNQLPATNRRG